MLHIPHKPCSDVVRHESGSLNVRQRHIHVSARSHCCLVHAAGPVGVIRDRRNLEIPPPLCKAITTEVLQVRSCLKPNVVRPIRAMHALKDLNHALGGLGPSTLARASRSV
jgi:hypothetical protein